MQPRVPIRVIKLGGSLLELSDLQQRFHAWLGMQTPARNLIVTGGGKAVEAVRELDATHHFNSKFTHWLCVDLMSVMATLASELLGLEQPLSTPGELSDFLNGTLEIPAIACVQPIAYYTPSIARQSNCSLPESWIAPVTQSLLGLPVYLVLTNSSYSSRWKLRLRQPVVYH